MRSLHREKRSGFTAELPATQTEGVLFYTLHKKFITFLVLMRPQAHTLHTIRTVMKFALTNCEILLELKWELIEKSAGLKYTDVIRFLADFKSLAE